MRQTISRILGYVGGGLLLLLGVLFLFTAPPAGIVVLALGLFVFPPVRRRYSIHTSMLDLAVWAVSLLLLLFGAIIALQLPGAGALALIAGLVALPPFRRRVLQPNSGQSRGSILAVIVLVGAAASMGLVYLDLNEPPERDNVTHSIGEPFTVNGTDDGQLRFNVTDVAVVTRVNSSSMETPVTPAYDGYLVVYVEVENVGDEQMHLSDSDIFVIGESETDGYGASPNAEYVRLSDGVRSDTEVIDLYNDRVEIDSDERIEGAIVYDVRAGGPYRLKVTPTSPSTEGDFHYVPLIDTKNTTSGVES